MPNGVVVPGAVPSAEEWPKDAAHGRDARELLLTLTRTGEPPRRHLARVASFKTVKDPLLDADQELTEVELHPEDALPFAADLGKLTVSANVLPATAGETRSAVFVCGDVDNVSPRVPRAIERTGRAVEVGSTSGDGGGDCSCSGETGDFTRPTLTLQSLPGTETHGLSFVGANLRDTEPELEVFSVAKSTLAEWKPGEEPEVQASGAWRFTRNLFSETPSDQSFTLEDGTWRRIVAYRQKGDTLVHQDYASGAGYTIRFGDGEFGKLPTGECFLARYRLGAGKAANVRAGTLTVLTDAAPEPILSVTNPLPVETGVDPETLEELRTLAPEAYRQERLFAVTPEDYGKQSERLPSIDRANGALRWTGSWSSVAVTADAKDVTSLSAETQAELTRHLETVRQAGRDVLLASPRYADVDLRATLCIAPAADPSRVEKDVLRALFGEGAFFDPDRYTFGTPLRRSALEDVLMEVCGVRAVMGLSLRRRGLHDFRPFDELRYEVGDDAVLRLENDPRHPERGSFELVVQVAA